MKRLIKGGVLLFLLFCGVQFSFAQEEAENGENPFKVNVSYTSDVYANMAGGNETGIRYLDNIDVNFKINFGELPLGLTGTTFYVYGLGNQGSSISQITGDIQGISNIEGDNSWRIFEVWAQKKFFLANSSILLGLYDINSEFNVLNSSLLFMNSSHGLDPTIALSGFNGMGPSTFPYTSLAARFKINPYKGLVLQGAVLDGVPSDPKNPVGTNIHLRESDGVFLIGEASLHSISDRDLQLRNRVARLQNLLAPGVESENKLGFGGWYYSHKKESWNPSETRQNEYGVYGFGEYEIIKGGNKFPANIKIFARLGLVNPEVNQLDGFLGGGLVATGFFKKRELDQTGVAIAYASASSSYINHTTIGEHEPIEAETNIEFTHQFVWNNYFQMQGNVQYILNPGFDASLDNAFVTGVRMIIGF